MLGCDGAQGHAGNLTCLAKVSRGGVDKEWTQGEAEGSCVLQSARERGVLFASLSLSLLFVEFSSSPFLL